MFKPILAVWLALACSSDAPTNTAPVTTGHDEAVDVARAARAWRNQPSAELESAVQHACERGLSIENPSVELDLALGDALSNVLLRPDLGMPRLERHRSELGPGYGDAWLDGLLRTGDLPRLASEHHRLYGSALDIDHPTARAISSQAALDGTVRLVDLRDGVAAARLIEAALAANRHAIDRPLDSTGAAFEALVMLLEGWQLEVATARTTFATDPDPLLTKGEVHAAEGRRRIVGYARAEPFRAPGVALDLQRTPRANTFAARGQSPSGRELLLSGEGSRRDGTLWLTIASDPARVTTWMQATDALLEARRAGTDEAEIASLIRSKYQAALLAGS